MSTNDPTGFDEREWQAQERGRQAPASGPAPADVADAQYRVIAQAVRSAPHGEPPADFAAGVMQRIAVREAHRRRTGTRMVALMLAVALSVLVVAYGLQGWRLLQQSLGSEALQWIALGGGCLALSWLTARAVEFARVPNPARP